MKLAEALIKRKNMKSALAQLIDRIKVNARVQEGDKPQEWPLAVYKEAERVIEDIAAITVRINNTNDTISFPEYGNIATALAHRDAIAKKKNVVGELLAAIKVKEPRWGRMEIKFEVTVEPKEVLEMHKNLTDRYQELDAKIQAANWQIDLL